MERRDYYRELEVGHDASRDEIKSAYRRLAKKYHPDINPDVTGSKFVELSHAYSVLRNPHKRAIYDGSIGTSNPKAIDMHEIARKARITVDNIVADTTKTIDNIVEGTRKTMEGIVSKLKKTTVFVISILGGIVLSAISIKSTGYAINSLTTTTSGLLGLILFVFGLFGLIFNINKKQR